MGIKSLNKFLKNNCPNVYNEIHISEYGYKKVAIDISLYMHKYKSICGDRWLSAFINLVVCLRKNDIHCVFIYDGGSPPEKDEEKEKRVKSKEKTEEQVYLLESALEEYHNTGEVDIILIELHDKYNKQPKRLLSANKSSTKSVDMKFVEDRIKKMKSYTERPEKKDFELTKKLFDILRVPYFLAPMEAETMCSCLCKRGIVDAVLSEDTDVLAYGAPIFLSKLDTSKGTCTQVEHNNVLTSLELNEKEFLDFCIMCGTDYNTNIFRVGPEKAYKHITEHRSIDEIGKNTKLDISVLKHVRCRELFTEYEKVEEINIQHCGVPNFNELTEFVFKHNLRLDVNGIRRAFEVNTKLVFEE